MDFKQVVGSRRTIRYFKSWQPVEPGKLRRSSKPAGCNRSTARQN
jgi:hypothetical protein